MKKPDKIIDFKNADEARRGKVISRGIIWNGIQVFVNKSFSFIVKLILAKLLFPELFGIIGMAAVFIEFIKAINEMGISAALIQRKEAELTEIHYETAFWTGVVWSILMFGLVALVVSPFASWFYDQPILAKIMPILALSILLSPIVMIHKVKLTRAMNFKRLAIINNTSSIFAGLLSITLALMGFGVWSLVFNSVAAACVSIPLFLITTRWLPGLNWDRQAFMDIFSFGMFTAGTSIVGVLLSNFDYLLVGKFVSAAALGTYTMAFILTDTVRSQIMSVVNSVMYPVYSQSQGDLPLLREYYLNVVKLNSLIVFPVMGVLLIYADPLIPTIFGDKWTPSVLPAQILAVSVMVHMMANSNTILIRGVGRADMEFKLQMIKTFVIFLPSLFIGIYYFKEVGAAFAVLFNKVASVAIAYIVLNKLVELKPAKMIGAVSGPFTSLFVAVAVGLVTLHLLKFPFPLSILLMLVVYTTVVFKIMKPEAEMLLRKIRRS